MEHAWVRAYVNWVPARGAKNFNATQHINANEQLNAWVDVDTSYKQYATTAGMNLQSNVPLDAAALLTAVQQGATVDTTAGFVQNLNSTNLQSQLTAYQTRVADYINATNPNATVGDVLGTKTIVQTAPAMLAGSVPFATKLNNGTVVRTETTALADSLKWKFRTSLASNPLDLYLGFGGDLIEYQQPTPKIAGRKITLSFIPATQADADLIASYLPAPNPDGSPIRPDQLPTSLPGYLLNLKAELRVDGQVVATSTGAVTMGQALAQRMEIYNPGLGTWQGGEDNAVIAGEYNAIMVDGQGVAQSQLQTLQTKLTATKTALQAFQANPANTALIAGLTKEDLSGDMLYAGILGYFATVDANDKLAERTNSKVITHRLPSYGRFFAVAQPHFFFGIVRTVSFPGLAMDVDYVLQQAEAKNEDRATRTAFMQQMGAAGSAAEHAVPENLFKDPNKPADDPTQPNAVSAVKALAIASSQGQRLYTLTSSNQTIHANTLASLSISADVKAEIADALSAGKDVTVHEADINASGFTGVGYVIIDPTTGAGAYKIEGGGNGGWLIFLVTFVLIAIAIIIPALTIVGAGFVIWANLLPGLALILAIDNARTFLQRLGRAQNFEQFNRAAAAASFDAMFDIVAATFARRLANVQLKDLEVELTAFWGAVMGALLARTQD